MCVSTCYRDDGVSIWGIIGGFLAFIIFAGVVVYCFCFFKKRSSSQPFFQSRIMSQRLGSRRELLAVVVRRLIKLFLGKKNFARCCQFFCCRGQSQVRLLLFDGYSRNQ